MVFGLRLSGFSTFAILFHAILLSLFGILDYLDWLSAFMVNLPASQNHQNQNALLISRGEIVFVPEALCKVEIEIQHEWKQEIKITI